MTSKKKANSRKVWLRYLRWACKALFLLLFTIPLAYVPSGRDWPTPYAPVNSIVLRNSHPFFFLPVVQSPCSVWLNGYCNARFGEWLSCPLGGIQALVTGRVGLALFLPTIVAISLVLVTIVILGNVFCGWICPVGTLIDCFDKAVERFLPQLDAKRERNASRREGNVKTKKEGLCSICPIVKVMSNKNGTSYGVLALAIAGSAVLRFNVFCLFCPIGITTRGLFHLKATRYVTGIINNILIEFYAIPLVAVLLSIKERRFWCKKLCPVGALLNITGSLNPFLKPKVKNTRCIMKSCPENCEDYHFDYCAVCRTIDNRRCEKVCPVNVKLVDGTGLNKCTKCMECYIACEYDAIEIKLLSK